MNIESGIKKCDELYEASNLTMKNVYTWIRAVLEALREPSSEPDVTTTRLILLQKQIDVLKQNSHSHKENTDDTALKSHNITFPYNPDYESAKNAQSEKPEYPCPGRTDGKHIVGSCNCEWKGGVLTPPEKPKEECEHTGFAEDTVCLKCGDYVPVKPSPEGKESLKDRIKVLIGNYYAGPDVTQDEVADDIYNLLLSDRREGVDYEKAWKMFANWINDCFKHDSLIHEKMSEIETECKFNAQGGRVE